MNADKQPEVVIISPKTSLKHNSKFSNYFKRNYDLYLLLVPGILITFIFKYVPLYGLIIAFKEFNIFDGFAGSPWVGLEQFKKVFSDPYFYKVFNNTLIISVYKLLFLFPLPIFLAIMLNEVKSVFFKRSLQTIIYLPHFLSWTIIYGIFFTILGSDGIVNKVLTSLGAEKIIFFIDPSVFRGVLVTADGWMNVGWGTIIYLAAIMAVDQELYEAAIVDGR